MTKTKVFVDGRVGTTGLRIYERLAKRDDIELITLSEELRKNNEARREALQGSDISFLCLPDDAAREAAALADGKTRIIDTSTAHRTADGWVYGFAELAGQRDKIEGAKLVANPGCHASGFIALVKPLIDSGILDKDAALSCYSLTGYSGGGKSMIADYESEERDALLDSPKIYALGQGHKHLPEMKALCGLTYDPIFLPVVGDFYSGMLATIPIFRKDINGSADDIKAVYKKAYSGKIVHFEEYSDKAIYSNLYSGKDDMMIAVSGNEDKIILMACFDNLGKGASGAAIQNMNIMMGCPETTGLEL